MMTGGIQFEPEGVGFLIPHPGDSVPSHLAEKCGYIRTDRGEWSYVTDIRPLEATAHLPSRIGFCHCVAFEAPIPLATLSHGTFGAVA
jgi:hypothetical protein